jgi:hypothetical protein
MRPDYQFHPIQESILKKLSYSKDKSFSEIRGDAESNKFSFHLKELRKDDLIEKTDEGYRLTKHGREILPYFDLENSHHPVVVLDLLVFSGESVYLKPKEEDPLDPFEGNFRAPSSRIGKNDRLDEKAAELFKEEFDREPDKMEKSGVFDSQVEFKDGSKQHYLVFYFRTEVEEKEGDNWFRLEELREMKLLPGLEKATQKIRWNRGNFIGTWDIVETSDGFEVEKLEF